MGWTPNNTVTITRVFDPERKIVVTWKCDVLGDKSQEFTSKQENEAIALVARLFLERAM